VPDVILKIGNNGARVRAKFGAESVGIGFQRKQIPGGASDFIFVDRALADAGNEKLPNTGRAARAHGMRAAVPGVEISDKADAAGGRRPDCKIHAGDAVDGFDVRAEFFVGVVVATFGHQVQIKIAELMRKRVGVIEFEGDAFMRAALDFVAAGFWNSGLTGGPSRFEEAFGAEFYGVANFRGILKRDMRLIGPGNKESNGPAVFDRMRTEKRKRIGEASPEKRVNARVEFGVAGRLRLDGLYRSGRNRFIGHRGLEGCFCIMPGRAGDDEGILGRVQKKSQWQLELEKLQCILGCARPRRMG